MSEHETGQGQVLSEDHILSLMGYDDDSHELTEAADVNADADTPDDTILDIATDKIAQEDANPPSDDWFQECPPSDDWFQECPPSAESQQAVMDLVVSDWSDDACDVTPPTDAELDRIYRQDAGLDIPADDPNADLGLTLVRALAAVLARKPENSRQYKVAATGLRDLVNAGKYSTDARKVATEALREHSIRLGEPSPSVTSQNSSAHGLAVALAHYAASCHGPERENALARLQAIADDDKQPIDARNEARKQLKPYLSKPTTTQAR